MSFWNDDEVGPIEYRIKSGVSMNLLKKIFELSSRTALS